MKHCGEHAVLPSLPFDDVAELLHRRVPPDCLVGGQLLFDRLFRWAYERDEKGLSVDRALLTGANPRAFWPDAWMPDAVISFAVRDLPSRFEDVDFRPVHAPLPARDGRPANPAHSEVQIFIGDTPEENPGKTKKGAVLHFRTHMKNLYHNGGLEVAHGSRLVL